VRTPARRQQRRQVHEADAAGQLRQDVGEVLARVDAGKAAGPEDRVCDRMRSVTAARTPSVPPWCDKRGVRIITSRAEFDIESPACNVGVMQRGDIWWSRCDLAFEDVLWRVNLRPVVLLSSAAAATLAVRAMWIVAPANDSRGIVELSVGEKEGLSRAGVLRVAVPQPDRILCDWLTTLDSAELVERAGALSREKLVQLDEMLRLAQLDPERWAP